MTAEKEKTKVGKLLSGKLVKNVLAPFVRAAVKEIPFIGTPIVEAVSNMAGSKKIDALTGKEVPKHSYTSIITQSAIAICVIIAFYTKAITIEQVIGLLKSII